MKKGEINGRLTPQQSLVLDAYLIPGTTKKAALLAAGYSEEVARKQPHRFFKSMKIAAEYERRLDRVMSKDEALHRIGVEARECSDPAIRLRALELLAKHHKLLTDKVEAAGPNGEPISIVFNLK